MESWGNMRAIALLLTALLVTAAVDAQPTAPSPEDNTQPKIVTVVLVDASLSMADRTADASTLSSDADAILAREAKQIRDSNGKAAIVFYRAADAKSCDASTRIGDQVAIPDVIPTSPKPVGATNLGTALNSAIAKIGDGEGRIVIISDGGQSNNCGFHVCTVAEEQLPGKPNLRIQPIWIERFDHEQPARECLTSIIERQAQQLSGALAAQQSETPESDAQQLSTNAIADEATSETNGNTQTGHASPSPTHVFLWVALPLASALLLALAAVGAHLHSRRHVIIEQQKRKEIEKNPIVGANEDLDSAAKAAVDETPEQANARILRLKADRENRVGLTRVATAITGALIWLVPFLILAIALLILVDAERSKFFRQFLEVVNSNIGAGLICSILVAGGGWVFVQFWQISEAKNKTRDYRTDLAKTERLRSNEAIRRLSSTIAEWRIEPSEKSPSKFFQFRARSDEKIDQIRKKVLLLASTVRDEDFLEQTNREMRSSQFRSIATRLVAKGRITQEAAPALLRLLGGSSFELRSTLSKDLADFRIEDLERA